MTNFKLSKNIFTKVGVTALALGAFVLPAITLADTLTRELQVGSTGSDVSSLQTFLAADPSIYPQGLVTGYFGYLTKAAVTNFQARNGIATVGRVGPITMAAINAQMGSGSVVGYDRQAPTIGQVGVSVSASSATLAWNTNENSSSLLYYSTAPVGFMEAGSNSSITVSGTSVVSNLNQSTAHGVTLSGLTANTTYNYVVYVKDASGNESVTWPSSFKTNN